MNNLFKHAVFKNCSDHGLRTPREEIAFTYCEKKNCSSDGERLNHEFAKFLRSLEQLI